MEYRAWVDGREAHVFNQPGFAGGTISWILIDMENPVEVLVRPHRRVDAVRILPRRTNLTATLTDEGALVRIELPGHYLLEWDQLLELPFFVIARPPQRIPTAPRGRRIEFGPGRHEPGRIDLQDGDELFLAPGAEVYGAIRAVDAKNIRIFGRGTLCQSHLPFGGQDGQHNPIELIRCQNAEIDGIVLTDGCTWNIVLRDCDEIWVHHLTIFSERWYSTDGINPCDSRNVLIEQCFVRCKDDCISVKGLQRETLQDALKPIKGIEVCDCLFWSDNNNGLVVGTETWASDISDIRFHRIDFVRVSGTCGDWAAAFAVQALADTHIHDIVFEDIEVEYCTGNPFSVLFLESVYGIPGQRRPTGGVIENICFRNIRFFHPVRRGSLIEGWDASRLVRNITFEDISFEGETVISHAALRLRVNEFAHGVGLYFPE